MAKKKRSAELFSELADSLKKHDAALCSLKADISDADSAELRELIPHLMAPAAPELLALEPARVTPALLLVHARRLLDEQVVQPAREQDQLEAARRNL